MLLFFRRSQKAKTPSQSSEHGVVTTGKQDASSSSFCVEWDVGLLRNPNAMEQNCQLTRHRNDSFVLSLLPTSCS